MLDAATLEAITQEARQAFLDEDAPECLQMLTEGFQELEGVLSQNPSKTVLQPIFKTMGRAAHSLKGGAGMAGLTQLNRLCHRMEDLFEALEGGKVTETGEALEFLSLALEQVQHQIEWTKLGRAEAETAPEITQVLEAYLNSLAGSEEGEVSLGDVSDFIRVALTVELESCIERAEKHGAGAPQQVKEACNLLLEECALLGQALSCPWLEELGHQFQEQTKTQPYEAVLPEAIAQIRSLRSQFLAGELTPVPVTVEESQPEVV
ncbi:MAG: Hpt domain-containing protein, partial [Cyanobacteriota bacterium]